MTILLPGIGLLPETPNFVPNSTNFLANPVKSGHVVTILFF
jgi:hypothetical protein